MKILITGGNGFIARNLYEQLKYKYNISSANRQELDLLDSSKVFDYIKKNKFDTIIHTATYDAAPKHSTKDPEKVLENNLSMFFNIVRCKDFCDKIIYFGSGAEYSRPHWIPKMKEEYFDKHVPTDQYGFSKYIMTKYTLSENNNIYNLRFFGTFGKYDDWRTRLIPNVCVQVVLNKPIVKVEQNAYYDYLYIDDLIKIVEWFIDNNPKKKVYNVCSGEVYSRENLAERIIKISGKKLNIKIEEKELGREYSGDNTLLLQEIRNFEFSSINSALKSLYSWYEENKQEVYDVNE